MRILFVSVALAMVFSCNRPSGELPVYGNKTVLKSVVDGKEVIDSIDYKLPPFSFVNQDSTPFTDADVRGKVYVADFFFTSCPSICPKMKKEMLRIYNKYPEVKDLMFLSFSIDPARDSVARLKAYSQKLGISDSERWNMLTGNKDSIYALAGSFLVSAAEDPDAPGGHVHSGNFILVDREGRIRGYYDGTSAESVDKLIKDIETLLAENKD